MGYLKAALAGLVGGFVVAAVVITVDSVRDGGSITWLMVTCADYVCIAQVWVRALKLPAAFVVGFAVSFVWFLRRHRLPGL